ncbi:MULTISPECIES: hypothetical protein [unclassified Leclercia]|uniref:Uncharacterized protein n=1 Tax=Leclercia barmai TaxID=2785629 RepID=A0ABS7RZG8_9ENTR|nr:MULTISPECIES: hypothetical protein [unclassified Leclercia]MBZ0058701.1 hypothetical protein [Leclercia sp. EMC7]MCM5696111.1 hypothetical protein [Leclercia sp. LTM01]MCM5702358.1 hypothetical protein [Leclercia sp. LTM14]
MPAIAGWRLRLTRPTRAFDPPGTASAAGPGSQTAPVHRQIVTAAEMLAKKKGQSVA